MLPCEFYYDCMSTEGPIFLRKIKKTLVPDEKEPGVITVNTMRYGRDFSFRNFQGVTEVLLEANGCVLYKESVQNLSEYTLPFFRGKSFIIPPGTAFAIISIILKGTFPTCPELEYTQLLSGCPKNFLDCLSYFEKIPGGNYIILCGGLMYLGNPQPENALVRAIKSSETVREPDPNYMKVYFQLLGAIIPPFSACPTPPTYVFDTTGTVEFVFETRFRHLVEEYLKENGADRVYYSEYQTVNPVATVLARKTKIQEQLDYIESVRSRKETPAEEVYIE